MFGGFFLPFQAGRAFMSTQIQTTTMVCIVCRLEILFITLGLGLNVLTVDEWGRVSGKGAAVKEKALTH